jgi:hypothetical protein
VGVVTPGVVTPYGEPYTGGPVVEPKPAVVPNVAGEFQVGGIDAAPGFVAYGSKFGVPSVGGDVTPPGEVAAVVDE